MSDVRHIEFAQYGVTNVHPVAIVFMTSAIALVFAPRRAAATLAILAVCVFMPMEQRVIIGGLDFTMLRLIMMVTFIRVIVRGEYHGFHFGKLDRLTLLWVLSSAFFYVLRIGPGGFVYILGVSFDELMSYFLIRILVRTPNQVLTVWKQLAWIVLVLTPFIVYEAATRHNVFGIFSYEGFEIAAFRDGEVRAKGPLSHPILTGTLGAVVAPVFFGIFRGLRKHRFWMGAAVLAATTIAFASGSSGPLMSWLFGILGWAIWRYRVHMRRILWSVFGLAVLIHFVRDKPVWHLILRLSSITGGTGHHRYYLIDAFINRFSEWALIGTNNTAHWGWGLQDTTNHYVVQGVQGGIVTLVLFILVLRAGFAGLRVARNAYERLQGPTGAHALLAWGCSVSLAVHCVSFISVSYFGQMLQFFFLFLGTVPAFAGFRRPARAKAAAASAVVEAPSKPPHFAGEGAGS